MTDSKADNTTDSKNENKQSKPANPITSILFIILAAMGLGYFIASNPQRFGNIVIVLLGFGAVIFVHELGHFVAAKSVGIMVEAFAIGFGPVVIGVKKVGGGFQVRLFPTLVPGKDDKGALSFVIPNGKVRPGETEYQIRLIPLGGFVGMLGQSDTGPDIQTDDPRAFGNKEPWKRAIVISAGVVMNLICGAIVFIIVFIKGVELNSTVVGSVMPDTPAARAGIKGGDEIIAINGKENVDLMEVKLAAAFADENEKVALTVRHLDGSVKTYEIESVKPQASSAADLGIKIFGISPSFELTIANVYEKEVLKQLAKAGFIPGDKIVAVNGQAIERYDQLYEILYPEPGVVVSDSMEITIERKGPNNDMSEHVVRVPRYLEPGGSNPGTILGMTPLIKLLSVVKGSPADAAGLQEHDIILKIGPISNPDQEEFSEYCRNHPEQPTEIAILRKENDNLVEKTVSVASSLAQATWWQKLRGTARPTIGVILSPVGYDVPIIAECNPYYGPESEEMPALTFPRGARMVTIGSEPINDWSDMMASLARNSGKTVEVHYQGGSDQPVETAMLNVPEGSKWIGIAYRPDFGGSTGLPLELKMKLFKGRTWGESLRMGCDRTYIFAAQTYLMLQGMFKGTVSAKAASGPVGILKMSYSIAEQKSLIYFIYFMAIINVCVAVFNFLPLPVLDGGIIVMLIIEKIKGSPVSLKVQEIVTYAGLVLILGLVLVVTFNDIVKIVTGQL
ncbi:MAG: site-2 protease family protein [Sedimentisphaerales bacterium]|nr:site-2 protease family protein [Sedimentisphaerales bacterium]